MITIEQLETAFAEDRRVYKTAQDHGFTAIALLRERIPYDICKRIIGGARHDVVYLCDIDIALSYLTKKDVGVLADCNVWIDEDNDCLALFV